jgi:hypothetical protein
MNKAQATKSVSILTASGLSSKTITDVIVTLHGSVVVVECVESGGSHFIKEKQGQIEVGGTLEWGTGTSV